LKKVCTSRNSFSDRPLIYFAGHGCRHRDHLRRLLDAQSNADPTHVYQLLRRRLRGANVDHSSR
jgi:hypothetical protein